MKTEKNNTAAILVALAASVALPVSANAATNIYDLTRSSLDGIVGQVQTSTTETLGYYDGNPPNTTLVGGIGSTGSRYGQDLVYRYTLPTLNPGETIESFTFTFQITAMRDHSGNDPELDLYLLNTSDPTTLSPDNGFYRGDNDTAHDLIGSQLINPPNNSSYTLPSALDVTFTINSGDALATLQGFYGGDHIPDQTEASFRFNLTTGNVADNSGLDRYFVNDDVNTSSFKITAVPEPSVALLGGLGMLALLRRRRD